MSGVIAYISSVFNVVFFFLPSWSGSEGYNALTDTSHVPHIP